LNTNYLEFVESLKQNRLKDNTKVRQRLQLRIRFILHFLQERGVQKLTVQAFDMQQPDSNQTAQPIEIDLQKPGDVAASLENFSVSSFTEIVLPTHDT
jgi:type II secretory pathway pseudopilin PulG